MQVMNSAQFEQTEVLIGQQGKTESFGVSEDAALMSMLSTGLYSNPLRTMLQEIMFNAWDAHHMVGIQQTKPIDIYLNDTTGLIVRDYGPGICKEDMVPIYCIYGNSTKREDRGSTGGFGLGSKSPFAYTESFTVASFYEGKQNLYLISRVSDDNDGRPGLTPILQDAPTEESGLRVTVPFKSERDLEQAYEYIKDLLYLSGIWCNLHYLDHDPEEFKSTSLKPMEWFFDETDGYSNDIYAVYGGVRYEIPDRDEYHEEYSFLYQLQRKMRTSLYIGFAPDTLTPLPSREGLNMSERTTENIKASLESLQEFFLKTIKPVIRFALEKGLDEFTKSEIIPEFLIYRWRDVGSNSSLKEILPLDTLEYIREDKPNDISENIWISLNRFVWGSTQYAAGMVGYEEFAKMRAIVWAKKFPKYRHLHYVSDGVLGKEDFKGHYEMFGPSFIKEFNGMLDELKTLTGQKLSWRALMSHRETWSKIDGWRGKKPAKRARYGQDRIINALIKDGALKTPKIENKDIFFDPDGDPLHTIFFPKTVIIAETATALNNTPLHVENYFAPTIPNSAKTQCYNKFYWGNFQDSHRTRPIIGLVVHKKKGQYDDAVRYLRSKGWTVIEGEKPEVKVRESTVKEVLTKDTDGSIISTPVPVKKEKPSFPLLDINRSDWINYGASEIEEPKAYFCVTLTAIRTESWRDTAERPSDELRKWIAKTIPNTAVLHNKSRAGQAERAGAVYIPTIVEKRTRKLLSDKDRILKMVLHNYAYSNSNLPPHIMDIPEIQKLFGIPYLRTKEKKQFIEDRKFLETIESEKWNEIDYNLKKEVRMALRYQEYNQDLFSVAKRMCNKTDLFSKYDFMRELNRKSSGEILMFSQKVARFLRTI